MTLTFGKKLLPEGLNVCINYEFNLLDHVGVVQKGGGVRQAFMTRRTDGQPENVMPSLASRWRHNYLSTTVNCKKQIFKSKKNVVASWRPFLLSVES